MGFNFIQVGIQKGAIKVCLSVTSSRHHLRRTQLTFGHSKKMEEGFKIFLESTGKSVLLILMCGSLFFVHFEQPFVVSQQKQQVAS